MSHKIINLMRIQEIIYICNSLGFVQNNKFYIEIGFIILVSTRVVIAHIIFYMEKLIVACMNMPFLFFSIRDK